MVVEKGDKTLCGGMQSGTPYLISFDTELKSLPFILINSPDPGEDEWSVPSDRSPIKDAAAFLLALGVSSLQL